MTELERASGASASNAQAPHALLAAPLDALGYGEADQERRAADTEAAQLARYGATGFDIIGVRDKAPAPEPPPEPKVRARSPRGGRTTDYVQGVVDALAPPGSDPPGDLVVGRQAADTILAKHPTWAHCGGCGEMFTSDSAFDAHLGPIPRVGRPRCKAPADVRRRGGKARLVFDGAKGAWKWDDPVGRASLMRSVAKARSQGDVGGLEAPSESSSRREAGTG